MKSKKEKFKKEKFSVITFFKDFIELIVSHPYKTLMVVFIFWFLGNFWEFEVSFFVALFFLFLILEFDYRILIGFALLFLLSCPVFLILEKDAKAEQMAIYAYYLLFIGVVLILIENVKDSRK